jgi:hypothetical protein
MLRPRRQRRTGKAALAWAAVLFVLLQLGFVAWGDFREPGIYDPEFAFRSALLQAQCAERPDRPLLAVLGSSRTVLEFRPERLPALMTADGQEALPFNFAHTSAGPVYGLLTYRRLLQAGHTPRWLVVEVMPLLLREEWVGVYANAAVAGELGSLRKYTVRQRLLSGYVKTRLLPCFRHRRMFLQVYLPRWVPRSSSWLYEPNLDRLGGERRQVMARVDPAAAARGLRESRARDGLLFPDFRPNPRADAALRALLRDSRRRGIAVCLLLAPESPEFRENYTPLAREQVRDYCRSLAEEFGARWVDARTWLAEDDFADGHHVLLPGQTHFTDRLGREVLGPWVAASRAAGS